VQDAWGQILTVSVIIPAYNTAEYVREALESVFAQTFRDFEVIVINDGSPDTVQLEQVLVPFLSRIVYLRQGNGGPSAARNAGIRAARGKYIAFLDSDDIWLTGYLAEQVNFLESHPNVEASIADAVKFGGPDGGVTWRMLKNGSPGILDFERMLRREGGQIPSASVARKQRVVEVGMFDEELRQAEDSNLLVRICFPDRAVGYLGKILVKYRLRPGSLSSDRRNRYADWVEALRRIGESLPLTGERRALLAKEIAAVRAAWALSDAYYHISKREFDKGAQCPRQANIHYRDHRITLAPAGLKTFPTWTALFLNRRRGRA
jgi:glycosyltransferase involved in cell wall biosynthesis